SDSIPTTTRSTSRTRRSIYKKQVSKKDTCFLVFPSIIFGSPAFESADMGVPFYNETVGKINRLFLRIDTDAFCRSDDRRYLPLCQCQYSIVQFHTIMKISFDAKRLSEFSRPGCEVIFPAAATGHDILSYIRFDAADQHPFRILFFTGQEVHTVVTMHAVDIYMTGAVEHLLIFLCHSAAESMCRPVVQAEVGLHFGDESTGHFAINFGNDFFAQKFFCRFQGIMLQEGDICLSAHELTL